MGRPHIEFIYTQALDWRRDPALRDRVECETKLLSHDPELGELTALIRIPAGWRARVTSAFQEELYLLDGALAIDGRRMARDGYFRLPANAAHDWRSESGAVAILYLNQPSPRDDAALVAIDSTALDWDTSRVPDEIRYMGIALKSLYRDPGNGRNRTWLLSVQPQVAPRGAHLAIETHSCAEEVLMLSGDITGPQGQMFPGAYFWRPRDTFHGPYGSRNGGMGLSRWRHGVQDTIFHGQTKPFDFDAPYRPDLPPELAHLADFQPATDARF